MPRYMIERTFSEGLHIPIDDDGATVCRGVVDQNVSVGVTWVHSYVSADRRRRLCVFHAADAETVREAYRSAGVAFDRIWNGTRLQP